MRHRLATIALPLLTALAARPLAAQAPRAATTLTIVLGAEPTLPIPTLISGTASQDVADQLFLRLGRVRRDLRTFGDDACEPSLARRWQRLDPVTLRFELDPRARWHDGMVVTSADVVFSFRRAQDSTVAPSLAATLRDVAEVRAEGASRVVIRYARSYGEQLFDACYWVPLLPAHLLARVPADSIATSAFARAPIGTGPYRWARAERGQFVELAAVPDFFLGRPKVSRLFFRTVTDPVARLDLLAAGEVDAVEGVVPPPSNIDRLQSVPGVQLHPQPTLTLGYALFNLRAPGDRARPHPILGDRQVREALVAALDRPAITRAIFGAFGEPATSAASQLLWIRDPADRATAADTARARRLLAARGWTDHDGDGILDRNGTPLRLVISAPATSAARRQAAQLLQAQWRRLGIASEISLRDFGVFMQRRRAGDFDVDLSAAVQDPSPWGLMQSWSCSGLAGSNVGQYCNPRVDSLLVEARRAVRDPLPRWREALRSMTADVPAVFLYTPLNVVATGGRVRRGPLHPASLWLDAWTWDVTPDGGR